MQFTDSLTSSTSVSEESSRTSPWDSDNDGALETEREANVQRTAATKDTLEQIGASTSGMQQRITAFMDFKRMGVNDNNVREFCFLLPTGAVDEQANSCARVDSVFLSRVGSRSHMRISRVVNAKGPETQPNVRGSDPPQTRKSSPSLFQSSVEERLRNAEQHLSVTSDSKTDLFSRLKAVEEKILFLSGVSPEYFESGKIPQPKVKRRRVAEPEPVPEELSPTKLKTEYDSISEIDQRIHTLRRKLKEKEKLQLP